MRGRHGGGGLHAVFRAADRRQCRTRLDKAFFDLQRLQDLLDGGHLVHRVVDHEIARQADMGGLAPEKPGAEGMKRRYPEAAIAVAQQQLDAFPHLFGGLVGEGDREHFVRLGQAAADQVRDPIRDDAGLSGSGAGQDEQRPIRVQNGLALFGIEGIEEVHYSTVTLLARLRG
jgi:hypothetical protein